jgi:hypothetical protein
MTSLYIQLLVCDGIFKQCNLCFKIYIVKNASILLVDYIPCNSFVQVKTAKLATALGVGGFGVVFAATTFAIRELDLRIMVIGMICACLNVLMYGSPLAAMVSFFCHVHRY